MTVFTMFFIELMASRFDIFGAHDHAESSDPAKDLIRDTEKYGDSNSTLKASKPLLFRGWLPQGRS